MFRARRRVSVYVIRCLRFVVRRGLIISENEKGSASREGGSAYIYIYTWQRAEGLAVMRRGLLRALSFLNTCALYGPLQLPQHHHDCSVRFSSSDLSLGLNGHFSSVKNSEALSSSFSLMNSLFIHCNVQCSDYAEGTHHCMKTRERPK